MELFGSGVMWGIPLTDGNGAAIAVPSPLLFGTLQDVELDIKFELKRLHGQNAFPKAIARGKGSITGKAKFASIFGSMFDAFVFGQGSSSSGLSDVFDTTGAVVPSTPFTIAVVPPNSGTYTTDLGVIDAATGRPAQRVTSAPTGGQYSVNASGVYTFPAASVGKTVYINYQYTSVDGVAKRGSVSNKPMGFVPTFRCDLYFPFNGKQMVLTLPSAVSDGLKLGFKNDDFSIPEFGFEASADASGNVMTWAFSE